MTQDQQPYRGSTRSHHTELYGGVPYLPPERVEHYHDSDGEKLPARSLAFRILLSLALGALAVLTLVRTARAVGVLVDLSANPGPQPDWSSALVGFGSTLVLALLFAAYPVVNLVRLARRRRGARDHA